MTSLNSRAYAAELRPRPGASGAVDLRDAESSGTDCPASFSTVEIHVSHVPELDSRVMRPVLAEIPEKIPQVGVILAIWSHVSYINLKHVDFGR